jgi:NADH:ubiquinone oxidoreductase subunit F (NADH-binding)
MARGARRTDPTVDALVDALERAGLRGHGGAYFPTATKLRAVAAQRGRPAIVVNGSEGEPLSRKDRFLLSARTDAVLDGVLAVAAALSADTVVIAVDGQRVKTIGRVQAALAARPELADGAGPAVEVVAVPAGFVAGQETALINFLNGGPAKPTATPPFVFERGLARRPTLVSNVETFAQIGRVLTGNYDASRWVTVSGAVAKTTVVAVGPATTVAGALNAAGGVTDPPSAVLLGGYGGVWAAAPDALELVLDEATLRTRGLTLGAGIVHVLGESTCAVGEVARITRWMACQSSGQCGPCVFGLDAIAGGLEQLCSSGARHRVEGDGERGAPAGLGQIERWCAMVVRRGGCAHPDGVARFVASALSVFAEEFSDHVTHGPCERCGTGASDQPSLLAA